MSETHEGYLLIVDITGYTRYLSESELDHAQNTLTALLELLVENTRPPLVISRLAGDAVISYGLREKFFQGQAFIEKIEDIYVAFRKTIERLVLNNTCRCNACANIPYLDLKFFIHYGTFGIQRISDHDELVGNDVNLLHRLLKNMVVEKTGVRAYALFTEAAVRQLGIEDFTGEMIQHQETYEYLGKVGLWVQDMQPVWERKRTAAAVRFPTERTWWIDEIDLNIPPERAWDYLIQPEFRTALNGSDRTEIANRVGGRIAPGSIYQCYHGDKAIPQTILEWQPFESMLVRELFPMSPAVSWLAEYHLEPSERGTRLIETISTPDGPILGRTLLRVLSPGFKRISKRMMADFAQRIEEDFRLHEGAQNQTTEVSAEQIRTAARESLKTSSKKE